MGSRLPGGDRARGPQFADDPPMPGGYIDPMEQRVARLEKDVGEIKDLLNKQVMPLLIRIDERIKDMPAAKEFGELKGRVAQLPSTLQLIGFVIAVLGIAGAAKYFGH